MKTTCLAGICLGLLGLAQSALAEDVTINRLLASQCAQCHGTNGRSVGNIERIDEDEAKDLYEDLMDMRSEDRPENIMDHQAFGYTPEQIARIAAYFGSRSGGGSYVGESGDGEDREDSESREEKDERKHRRERYRERSDD